MKNIEERLDHKNLREIINYHSDQRKQRYELVDEPNKQSNIIFIDERLAIKVIMECKTTSAHKYKTRLRFTKSKFISTKEQSLLTRIMSSFEGENM